VYRFEEDTTRPSDPWKTSIRTHSAWTFKSEQATGVVGLPLLQLDYEVDTDLAGDAAGGSRAVIGITPRHLAGAVGAGAINGATLEISYDDGGTWQPLTLTRHSDTWEARVHFPKEAGFVSLRATASDDAGNAVEQEVIRAFGLK
jgi:hypothetical protein